MPRIGAIVCCTMLDDSFFPDLFELVETQCVRDGCGKLAASREHWPYCSADCAKSDVLARARIPHEQARRAVQRHRGLVRQVGEHCGAAGRQANGGVTGWALTAVCRILVGAAAVRYEVSVPTPCPHSAHSYT